MWKCRVFYGEQACSLLMRSWDFHIEEFQLGITKGPWIRIQFRVGEEEEYDQVVPHG